jgi:hypothetical protein
VFLSAILFVHISCENVEENPEINADDYYGDGSYFISLARLKSPEINVDFCGDPKTFELRNESHLDEYGTVTVYGDGHYLNLHTQLLAEKISEGWDLGNAYIWIGLKEDWNYDKKGPAGGWSAVPGIIRLPFSDQVTNGLQQIVLEDWMFESCFVIGIRITVYDSEGTGISVEAFNNHETYITYSFNDPFCLEKCEDPGTHLVDYWINNPDAWPYGLTIGNVFYPVEVAIQTINEGSSSNDMTYTLFEQLVSAKLNVALGNTSYCIFETIEAADSWMEEYGPVGNGVSSTSSEWNAVKPFYLSLINYNAGALCADPSQ